MKARFKIAVFFLGLFLAYGLNLQAAVVGEKYFIPGDARKGWEVFSTKGCMQCHGMGEKGKTPLAPDLSKSSAVHLSSGGLAAQMWNHAPEMWEKMSAKSVVFQRLNETEMADLFAFLYFIRHLDEPGNAANGKVVLEKKGCTACHSIGVKRGKIGPDLAQWIELTNPIQWVQKMWNHGMKMKTAMEKGTVVWPKLEQNDVADIIAYMRRLRSSKEEVSLALGDPTEGRKLFFQKGCERCHSTQGTGKMKGPDLGVRKKDFPPTIGQLAGLMWNHLPAMLTEMRKENIPFPELSANEMANIMAYLFSIRYFDPAGDRIAGKRFFSEKKCGVCHDIREVAGAKKEGPNLARLKGKVSPISIATALWNHGPTMIGKMREKNLKWNKLSDKELIDLMEYLNRGD